VKGAYFKKELMEGTRHVSHDRVSEGVGGGGGAVYTAVKWIP
jgi:hypothetical protein